MFYWYQTNTIILLKTFLRQKYSQGKSIRYDLVLGGFVCGFFQNYSVQIFLSKPLKVVPNPGGSGALMWFSNTGEYVLKTVDRSQGRIQNIFLSLFMDLINR